MHQTPEGGSSFLSQSHTGCVGIMSRDTDNTRIATRCGFTGPVDIPYEGFLDEKLVSVSSRPARLSVVMSNVKFEVKTLPSQRTY